MFLAWEEHNHEDQMNDVGGRLRELEQDYTIRCGKLLTKVFPLSENEINMAEVQTHTDKIMHLEEELASLRRERAVTMNFHCNVTIIPLYHVTISFYHTDILPILQLALILLTPSSLATSSLHPLVFSLSAFCG